MGRIYPKIRLIEEVNRQNQLPNIGLGSSPKLIIYQFTIPDPKGHGLLVPPAGIKK